MAIKFNPRKFYTFNNVKVLTDPADIILYADSASVKDRFNLLLNRVLSETGLKGGVGETNFEDLIRLITGLGFVIAPGKMGVLSDPIPMFKRSEIFNSEAIAPGKTKIVISSDGRKEVGQQVYRLFNLFKPEDYVFQDKNFSVPDIEQFSVKARPIVTKTNVFDIYENDQFFTNGELKQEKIETSLTYAYAFETFEVQGQQELILKKIELASPNNQKFIEEANNESDFTLVDKLKNILYDGENSANIEKQVLLGGAPENIGIDKLYNIVTVEIPKTRFGLNNILDYSELYKSIINPPSNLNVFDVHKNTVGGANELKKLITQLSFLASIANPSDTEILKVAYGFNLNVKQLQKAQAEFLAATATNKDVISSKITNFKKLQAFLTDIIVNNINLLSTVQTEQEPEFVSKFIIGQQFIALDAYYRLYEGLYNKREIAFSDITKLTTSGLTKYNISELFQILTKENEIGEGLKEAFDFGARQNALYRNSRLSGIKVIKSRIPYNPIDLTGFNESIVQTFHIAVNQGEQDKTLTLFDSQVIYGKEYYYTAFGVYEVDGKFYTYDNIVIDSEEIKEQTGKKIVLNKFTEPVEKAKFFKNPCCRTLDISDNQNLFVGQAGGFTNEKGAKDVADAFWDNIKKKLPQTPNKTSIYKFAFYDQLTFGQGFKAIPIPGLTNRDTIEKQGPGLPGTGGYVLPPIDLNSPETFPILTYTLYSLYVTQLRPDANGSWLDGPLSYGFTKDVDGSAKIDLKPDDLGPNPTPTQIFFHEKKKEMMCFLCRRAGTTDPKAYPTAARLIEQYIRNQYKDDNFKFLGGIVDCRQFGYKNADGFGGFKPPNIADGFGAVEFGAPANPINAISNPVGLEEELTGPNRCTRVDPIFQKKNIFNSIEFETNEMDSKTIVEVPLDDDKVSIVGRVPMPPVVTFVPLADVDNKMLIRFQEAVQTDDYEQPIDAMLSFLNGSSVMKKLKEQSNSEEFVLARSQGDLDSVIMFRSDVKPNSLTDIIINENAKNVSIDWKVAEILDPILPNKDYWYVFATRDFTGLYSAASPVFRLKLVNDSGYTYADLEPYKFITKEEKTTTKTFKKLIKFKPSFDETLANNTEQVGTFKLFSTIKKGNSKGATDAPPKFKIRIRSRKTKRAFDINLKYTQEIQQLSSMKLLKVIKERAELIDESVSKTEVLSEEQVIEFVPGGGEGAPIDIPDEQN